MTGDVFRGTCCTASSLVGTLTGGHSCWSVSDDRVGVRPWLSYLTIALQTSGTYWGRGPALGCHEPSVPAPGASSRHGGHVLGRVGELLRDVDDKSVWAACARWRPDERIADGTAGSEAGSESGPTVVRDWPA